MVLERFRPWPGPKFGVVFVFMEPAPIPSIPLSVDNVFKSYGSVEALRGVSFGVKEGEIFGLLGPNGAGKTSLISIIVTLEKATQGNVKVFGHDVADNS